MIAGFDNNSNSVITEMQTERPKMAFPAKGSPANSALMTEVSATNRSSVPLITQLPGLFHMVGTTQGGQHAEKRIRISW